MFVRARGRVAVLAAAAVAAVLAPSPASAEAGDVVAAELTNALDQAAAADPPADPNVTCTVHAGGRDLVQHTNYVVGEVYGQDFGTAYGGCASLDTARAYRTAITVRLEYFTSTGLTTGYWSPVSGCDAASEGDSASGVAAPVPAVALCGYRGASPYLNRYHRAHAVLIPGLPGARVRHAYSPIWFMAP